MNERGHILLVEDDMPVRDIIAAALRPENFRVTTASSLAERDRILENEHFDLMITDIGLADGDALDSLGPVRDQQPDLPIIAISAQNSFGTALRASEIGVFEYFPKPFDIDELIAAARQATRLTSNADSPQGGQPDGLPLIGRSPPMQQVYRLITRLLNNDLSALLLGESGTGKELVAQAIHELGHRKNGPFVAVNMAAIPSELIEAELFGHEKGAFTGAVGDRPGKFEQADGGTLFLDEIGDMPIETQTRLLRILQSGEIVRVGSDQSRRVDVRIVAATHQDMTALIAEGRFRQDLYYRINVVPIHLPPLRERTEDIDALCDHFLAQAVQEGLPNKRLDPAARALLRRLPWNGNVRELKNLILRLAATEREEVIGEDRIADHVGQGGGDTGGALFDNLARPVRALAASLLDDPDCEGHIYAQALARFEKPLLTEVLMQANGNQIKAANLLGINRNTLRKKLTDYEIDPSHLREADRIKR